MTFTVIVCLVVSLINLTAGDWRQAQAQPVVTSGFLTGVTILDGGAGYLSTPGVTIRSVNVGSGAKAFAVLSGDKVSQIVVTSAGSGYSLPPYIQIDPPARTDVLLLPQTISAAGWGEPRLVPANLWNVVGTNSNHASREFQSSGAQGFVLRHDTNTVSRGPFKREIRMDQSVGYCYTAGGSIRVTFRARIINAVPNRPHILTVYRPSFQYGLRGDNIISEDSIEVPLLGGDSVHEVFLGARGGEESTIEFYNGILTPSNIVLIQNGYGGFQVGSNFAGETVGEEAIQVSEVFVTIVNKFPVQRTSTFNDNVAAGGDGLISTTVNGSRTLVLANPGSGLWFINALYGSRTNVLASFDGSEPRFPLKETIIVETNMFIRAKPVVPGYNGQFDEVRFEVFGPFLSTEVVGKGAVVRSPYHPNPSASVASTVTVEAIPELGWKLIRWEGNLTGNVRSQSLILDTPKMVRAVFAPDDSIISGDLRMLAIRVEPDQSKVSFAVSAPVLKSWVIQTSEDMIYWEPWLGFQATQPITSFSDPSYRKTSRRFYRVTSQ